MNLLEINDKELIQKTNLSRKLTIGGKTVAYPVYKIRLDLLFYNDRNDRIATWLTQYNSDPSNTPFEELSMKEYNNVIEKFIVDSNPAAIEKTKNNIALVNQREPGAVLFDGHIIDGNRRFTCLRMINRTDNDVKYFESVILDRNTGTNQKQIKMLELSIQHGEEQRVEYNLIDLTVGAYHDIIETQLLTIQEYAASTNESVAEVKKRLDVAELIIEFLKYIGMPKQYHVAREMQIYSLMYETVILLKRCENDEEKRSLKTTVFNNILTNSIVDQRKFIRNIKHMMDAGVHTSYFKRQNKINERITEAIKEVDLNSVKDIEKFAKNHEDISEELEISMDRSMTNMKKSQSRAKPSQAVSKSISVLSDIDLGIIDTLSDGEKEKLNKQLSKLTKAVSTITEVCSDDVIEEGKKNDTDKSTDQKRLLLEKTNINDPYVYCCNIGKTITNLNFSMEFGAYKHSEKQRNNAQVIVYFVNEEYEQMSPVKEITVRTDEKCRVSFSLDDKASSLSKCYLVIRSGKSLINEATALIEFRIDIAFSIGFGF